MDTRTTLNGRIHTDKIRKGKMGSRFQQAKSALIISDIW